MSELPAHFFRHEYGRLVAMLSRRVGLAHLALVEDAVQAALLAAVDGWPRSGMPEQPSAWLFRAAYNQLYGELRARTRRTALASRQGKEQVVAEPDVHLAGDVRDDLLRMLFACCDDALPVESQLALSLKVLCGFDVREIAERLFLAEAAVYKRIERARGRLREAGGACSDLSAAALTERLPAVQAILYVMFTEGYLSSRAGGAVRRELCEEALRLARELAEHGVGAVPDTYALVALMHLQLARLPGRTDDDGGLLLLEQQDRSRWDARGVSLGLDWLARASRGPRFSRYHAEAGIAAEHCLAPSLARTRWDRIVACYELLERVAPSPMHTLGHALALAEWQGPEAGLVLLARITPPAWLVASHHWAAVLADLHRRAGHVDLAATYREQALARAPSAAVRALLVRRLG